MKVRCVLFDLDGTLLDTGPDLVWALNAVLREEGRSEVPYERIRPAISHGAQAMVIRGFELNADDPSLGELRDRMIAHYARNIAVRTTLFAGMAEVLELLEHRAVPWGIVTNKNTALTDLLLKELALTQRTCCVVSGDTLSEKKPHPAPILYACATASCAPEQCLYVGDAKRDIEAGRRAGTLTGVALFGYLGQQDSPTEWGADELFDSPNHLHEWLSDQL